VAREFELARWRSESEESTVARARWHLPWRPHRRRTSSREWLTVTHYDVVKRWGTLLGLVTENSGDASVTDHDGENSGWSLSPAWYFLPRSAYLNSVRRESWCRHGSRCKIIGDKGGGESAICFSLLYHGIVLQSAWQSMFRANFLPIFHGN
jgi:hypothetical protein